MRTMTRNGLNKRFDRRKMMLRYNIAIYRLKGIAAVFFFMLLLLHFDYSFFEKIYLNTRILSVRSFTQTRFK